jgi:predicted transcriptional regulator
MRKFEIMAAFDKVLKQLEVIDAKVSGLPQVQVQVSNRFLPTMNALSALGCGTATQVSKVTGRSRAFESKNLNELHAMGLLKKRRQGRMKIFEVVKEE